MRPIQDISAVPTELAPRPPRSNTTIEEKRREVAAIAAKFAPASKPEPHPSPSVDPAHRPDPARFAERLMERYGYKKGEGIGAEGNKGMVRPLEARVAKRGTARGVIVNRDRDEAAIAREMYGEPSEVVAFDLALDSDSDVAQNLQQEIGGFCALTQRIYVPSMATSSVRFSTRCQISYVSLSSLQGWPGRIEAFVHWISTLGRVLMQASTPWPNLTRALLP